MTHLLHSKTFQEKWRTFDGGKLLMRSGQLILKMPILVFTLDAASIILRGHIHYTYIQRTLKEVSRHIFLALRGKQAPNHAPPRSLSTLEILNSVAQQAHATDPTFPAKPFPECHTHVFIIINF
jgi:hypothetical protein